MIMPDFEWWLKVIMDTLEKKPDYTGSIKLNFFAGKVVNMNKSESIISHNLKKGRGKNDGDF